MKNLTGVFAIFMLLLIGLACSGSFGDETTKANVLVDDANKFVTTANESVTKVGTKADELEKKIDAIKGDADLKSARDFGKELMPLYDSMSENFKKASDKFDEASKVKIQEKHKEYLETKAKEMKLRSEYALELKKIPQALIDSDGEKAFRDASGKIAENVNKMTKEAKELSDKADKIQKDNPDVMKQN